MERGQGIENFSHEIYLSNQRTNSLRHRFGKVAAGTVLASSLFSSPANTSLDFDLGILPPAIQIQAEMPAYKPDKIILPRADYASYLEPEKTEIVAYDHTFDFKVYEAIRRLPLEEMWQEKERLDAYTEKQLQTILAERLNVLTSTFYYDMKDGRLWGKDMNEPAIDSFKRGRDYRRVHGNPIDFKREDAEITGFQKIEEMLRDGKSVLSISPQGENGSIYQHNFYDVFMWKNGKIEAKRFSSGLKIEDYKRILGISREFKDSDFLASPIDISGIFESAEEVHGFFHIDHVSTDTDFFENVIIPSTMQQRYGALKALFDNDEYGFAINFNGMFNLADDLALEHKRNPNNSIVIMPPVLSESEIEVLGKREVKEKQVGCGASSGVKLHKTHLTSLIEESKSSVKEYGEQNKECEHCKQTSADNHYHCPGCNKRYADETSKAERTQECGCGFEFGCKKD